jgi:hypothetical protein
LLKIIIIKRNFYFISIFYIFVRWSIEGREGGHGRAERQRRKMLKHLFVRERERKK